MDNNDILIRLRYALDIKDADMVEVFRLGGLEVTKEAVQKMLKNPKKDEATDAAGAAAPSGDDQLACDNATLESFLNGLITSQRGKPQVKPGEPEPKPEFVLNNGNVNNLLLKKVKIALTLTNEDMLEILESAGVTVSKSELSAVLRKEGHRNYKPCGDRYARNFLKGLALRYRG
ncbi:MAG: DUF1456 family protein [Trichococcus flocculiformis]|uniref:DUF1456 family protein n=1 Tax=Trichococcus flocculiformis TaxID=82803 RepID=A0A847D3V3_9LACT|nr:DUF1456 family protein [Trichococcus flocculiformis]NLD31340.1 DUF1456 family protein [Trichococcus flocculiformis]